MDMSSVVFSWEPQQILKQANKFLIHIYSRALKIVYRCCPANCWYTFPGPYNPFLVYCRELAPGTVSLTGDWAQGDDSKHDLHYNPY